MDIAKLSERLMGMDDATWAKHSNPWSGWTRLTILPLLCFVIWSRVWFGWSALWLVLGVLFWTWLNPRLLKPPHDNSAWMTKGVLGERVWLARELEPIPEHHANIGWFLNSAAGLGIVIMMYGLWTLDFGWTIAGLFTTMIVKLWFLDRMVWLLSDTQNVD